MKTSILGRWFPAVLLILALPRSVMAHPGHGGHGFTAGLAHPLSGIDHLAAMIGIGIWAMQRGGRARWLIPATFVLLMALGGVIQWLGVHVPMVESGIMASVLVIGLLVTFSLKLPLTAGMGLVAVFSVCHGAAHAAEMPANAAATTYGIGFVLATSFLHATGIALAILIQRIGGVRWVRASGVAMVAASLLLFLGWL
jgi:urease accessory protein